MRFMLKKCIEYKGKKLSGFVENKSNIEATTVQAFMVHSLYSDYKEIVALVPVNNMNASYLHELVCKVLNLLEEAGFVVVCLISDNNRINRNMFQKLGHTDLQSHVTNPANDKKNIFLLFDSVHLIKSIRNNWINQLDSEKTFICPDFYEPSKIIKPKFSHLRSIYHKEKDAVIKLAHKISYKCVYPSSLDRQNVQYAVNIFHESNDVALQKLLKTSNPNDWEDTQQFLKIIRK